MNIKVPWFSIIYSIPQKFFGSHQYVVLYTSALLGSLVVAIGTALTMSALGRKVTVLSGALLVCNGALVHFARSGYPVSLATLLMLLSALFMHLYLIASCSKRGWLYLTAAAQALATLSYIPAYAGLIGLLAMLGLGYAHSQKPAQRFFRDSLFLIASTLTVYLLLICAISICLTGQISLGAYLYKISQFGTQTATIASGVAFENLLQAICDLTYWQGAITATLLAGLVTSLILKSQVLSRQILCFIGYSGAASTVYVLNGFIGLHTVYARHLALFLPFFLILAAYALSIWCKNSKVFVAVSALLIGLSAYGAHKVVYSTYRTSPMLADLDTLKVDVHRIATKVDLHHSTIRTTHVPTSKFNSQIQINWELLHQHYRSGDVQYLLTSGLGGNSRIGHNDPAISTTKPIKSWPHPYRATRSHDERIQDFELYDLGLIFEETNRRP